MRLLTGVVAAALAGLALGSADPRNAVYLLQRNKQHSSTETPALPKEVARHILLQRTSRSRYGSDLRDIPSSIDAETAVEHIARFGKNPAPLFAQTETSEPSQLVILVENTKSDQAVGMEEYLAATGYAAAFTISDPPSATANSRLMTLFQHMGIAAPSQCNVEAAINPFDKACWGGKSLVVKYDAQEISHVLERLLKIVVAGDVEALLVFLPDTSRSSKLNDWSVLAAGSNSDLRRRDETVIIDDSFAAASQTPPPAFAAAAAVNKPKPKPRKARIPACFSTFDGCMEKTGNCTNHGACYNKWGKSSDSDKNADGGCYTCRCQSTVISHGDEPKSHGRKTMHWGGNVCQKEDISVPFWLLTGFTITIIGAVSFAIGLLYSVGDEQLPGVIGAGVSRSK